VVKYESFLKEVKGELEKRQIRALRSAGMFVLGEVSLRAPVRTGNLKGSYHTELDAIKKIVYIGTNVHYAPYMEFGTGIHAESGKGRQTPWAFMGDDGQWRMTRGTRPRPHLRPAFMDNVARIQDLISREMAR
jgi:HK97 gp10 family phage protein